MFLSGLLQTQEEEEEEDRRDYDMHRLAREEKLKGKKLRGKRKRKENEREKAPGQDFRVDVADERFAAVLEGDTRFGIDRTDSSFKVCIWACLFFLSRSKTDFTYVRTCAVRSMCV